MLIEICNRLALLKNDLVFVGGVSMQLNGIDHKAKDIDIVVKNLDQLDQIGNVNFYRSKSKFSKSGNRANIIISDEIIIDIFVEENLPDYKIINGLKCETLDSLRNHFKELQKIVNDQYWFDLLQAKINKLR